MTVGEVVLAAARAGVTLALDPAGKIHVKGQGTTPELLAALKENKPRLVAVLRLRAIHAAMGFSPANVEFIEQALLSGRVSTIKIVARPPEAVQ